MANVALLAAPQRPPSSAPFGGHFENPLPLSCLADPPHPCPLAVFVKTKREAVDIEEELYYKQYRVAALHGDKSQQVSCPLWSPLSLAR